MRAARRLCSPVLLTGALLVAAGPAPAAPRALTGGLSVSPALVSRVASAPDILPALTLVNTTRRALRVRLYPALVRQSLGGGLVPLAGKANRRRARRILAVFRTTATLPAGGAVSIPVRLLALTPGRAETDVAIVSEAVLSPARRGAPRYRVRLITAYLLRRSATAAPRGHVSRVRVVGRARSRPVALLRAVNDGAVSVTPTEVRVVVRGADGRKVAARTAPGRILLPRARRDLAVLLPRLRAGRYRVIASAAFGGRAGYVSALVVVSRPGSR